MARALIAGCGYVGTELGRRLARAGHTVYGLRRTHGALPSAIRGLAADLTDPKSLGGLPEGIEWVFYTAGPGSRTEEAYANAYVRGVACLLEHLCRQDAPVHRFLFTSSTAVYGQTAGEWVDERSPTEPGGFPGKRLLEGERLALGGPFPATVLRLSGIYGPGRTRLLHQVASGEARLPAREQATNRIHRDDCAGALAHLMELPEAEPVYLGSDRDPADRREVLRWLAEALGVSSPPPEVPNASDPAPTSSRGHKRCRSDRLVQSGYAFEYLTFREGYRPLVAEFLRGAF